MVTNKGKSSVVAAVRKKTDEKIVNFALRLPASLRVKLHSSSNQSYRSINQEIIARLQHSVKHFNVISISEQLKNEVLSSPVEGLKGKELSQDDVVYFLNHQLQGMSEDKRKALLFLFKD